jgi:hypothetical protein
MNEYYRMELVSIQNIIIIVLIITLIFSYLGINILVIVANFAQQILNNLAVIIIKLLATLGYTTGKVLNTTSEVVTSVGKTSLDVVNGTIHDIDNVIINASASQVPNLHTELPNLNNALNSQSVRSGRLVQDPIPSPSTMPVQNPISSAKTSYCLVGEYQSKRGCIEVGENDLCMSGQLFSSRELCMNPTLTTNAITPQQIAPFNSVSMFPLPNINPLIPNELRPQGIYNA